MSLVINGSGSITGLSVGGLPDGTVDAGTLATNSVDSAELIDGAVDDSHMAAMAASKLTGTVATANIADNAITLAKMASGTDGNIISYDASGNPVAIATGSDGQILTSTGAGSPPAFETPAGGGKVLQVIQSVSNTATYPTNSWTDVTGSSISITPSSSSSKILYIFNTGGLCGGDTRGLIMKILRGTTQIRRLNRYGYSTVTLGAVPIFLTYLDSPNTTSAVTYKIQAAEQNTSGAWEINDAAETAGAVVIAMEIAG